MHYKPPLNLVKLHRVCYDSIHQFYKIIEKDVLFLKISTITLIYFIVINILTLIVYGIDKYRAIHGKWRLSCCCRPPCYLSLNSVCISENFFISVFFSQGGRPPFQKPVPPARLPGDSSFRYPSVL